MIDDILSIIFGRFIVRFLGGNTRYFFLKFFGFSPDYNAVLNNNDEFSFVADFYNVVIGFAMLFVLIFAGGCAILIFE